VLAAAPASAHDLWIEPATFGPAPGSMVAVALRVGDGLPGEPMPRRQERIVRFALVGPLEASAESLERPPAETLLEETPLDGVEGVAPAGFARVGGPGLYAVVYRSTEAAIELPATKFESYLAEEGLERIVDLRAARGESGEPGRELYSRSVKALLAAGAAGGAGGGGAGGNRVPSAAHAGDRPLGLDLELIAERDPRDGPAPGGFPFRLLRAGEPLAAVLVEAVLLDQRLDQPLDRPLDRSAGEPTGPLAARSDAAGRVRFDLAAPGRWRITAVDMREAPAGSGADWRSVWTALTFELAAPAR
jgi:hypothetical protein